jgi:hypothetical protein
MNQPKLNFALFGFVILSMLISLESFAQSQCLCEFERRDSGENHTTVNIFSADQENYGLVESFRYKVLRDDTPNENSYSIQVMLDQKTYLYEVENLQLYFDESRIGYMSNLQIGLTKIISHLLPEACSRVSQMHPSLKEILFNT